MQTYARASEAQYTPGGPLPDLPPTTTDGIPPTKCAERPNMATHANTTKDAGLLSTHSSRLEDAGCRTPWIKFCCSCGGPVTQAIPPG